MVKWYFNKCQSNRTDYKNNVINGLLHAENKRILKKLRTIGDSLYKSMNALLYEGSRIIQIAESLASLLGYKTI